jgi:hypothetical protein
MIPGRLLMAVVPDTSKCKQLAVGPNLLPHSGCTKLAWNFPLHQISAPRSCGRTTHRSCGRTTHRSCGRTTHRSCGRTTQRSRAQTLSRLLQCLSSVAEVMNDGTTLTAAAWRWITSLSSNLTDVSDLQEAALGPRQIPSQRCPLHQRQADGHFPASARKTNLNSRLCRSPLRRGVLPSWHQLCCFLASEVNKLS